MLKHEPYASIDYEDLENGLFFESSDDEEGDGNSEELLMNDMRLVAFNSDHQISGGPSASDENLTLRNDQLYEMCTNLNDEQKRLFNFIMKYTMELKFNEIYTLIEPSPFFIFLRKCGRKEIIKILTCF